MLSPLPRRSHWWCCFAHPSSDISLPRYGSQVGLRIVLFEACSAFTRVTACTLALSPYFVTRFTRRLQPLRYLHDCSGCFRRERIAGWDLHPLEKRRLITAHAISGRMRLHGGASRAAAPAIVARKLCGRPNSTAAFDCECCGDDFKQRRLEGAGNLDASAANHHSSRTRQQTE
jgi:hypothetical protein